MDNTETIGIVFIGLAAILGVIVQLNTLVKPLKEKLDLMNSTLIEIKATITTFNEKFSTVEARLNKHGEELDELNKRVIRLESNNDN